MKQEEFNLLIFELLKQIIQNQSEIIDLLKLNNKNKNIKYWYK